MKDNLPTKQCVACDKQLECAVLDWDTFQPHDGGEIQLLFGYGSCKYDLEMHCTKFRGIICDDCAEKIVEKMTRVTNVKLDENGREIGNRLVANIDKKDILEGQNE